MLTESMVRLKVAFASIPWKGLFYWEGVLYFDDQEYQKVIEENLTNIIKSFPPNEQQASAYYQEILNDLRTVRKDIKEKPEVKSEVEKIRQALIDESAQELLVNASKEQLAEEK